MKRILTVLLCASMLLACFSGCNIVKAQDLMTGISANQTSNDNSVDDYSVITDFSLRLFRNCKEGNSVMSPLSVLYALAMTANGADGNTLTQMEEVFGTDVGSLNIMLKSCSHALGEELKCADSIWYNNASVFTPEQNFLQTNADYFGAGLFSLPFDENTRKSINKWVEENTDGMIKDMLDTIPADAVMYLINALCFDAKWAEVYTDAQVSDGIFNSADGAKQNVQYMHSDEHHYIDAENAQGFMKYYEGGRYAFLTLLPDEGVSVNDCINSLTAENLRSYISNPAFGVTVNAAIPKFEGDFSLELSDMLKAMGMTDAFDSDLADFSSMGSCEEGRLCIGRVLHKAHIEVTEQGTRAAAATAVEMKCESAMPGEVISIELNRPFVYMIVDVSSGIPVFMGSCTSIG